MLYFKQLLAGREFAKRDPIAAQMRNFSYLIGDTGKKECVVVDPAWDVKGLLDVAHEDGFKVVGALATHYHPDHIGGDLFGNIVEGIVRLEEEEGMPVHCNRNEAQGIRYMTGLAANDLSLHDGGDVLTVGDVKIELLHTPGHTPGSQCFLVDGRLVAGDTLFVQGCGRVDLPGGDAEEMYRTLTQRLAKLPDTTVLYPGHDYGDKPASTFEEQRRENYAFRIRSLDDWLAMMA